MYATNANITGKIKPPFRYWIGGFLMPILGGGAHEMPLCGKPA